MLPLRRKPLAVIGGLPPPHSPSSCLASAWTPFSRSGENWLKSTWRSAIAYACCLSPRLKGSSGFSPPRSAGSEAFAVRALAHDKWIRSAVACACPKTAGAYGRDPVEFTDTGSFQNPEPGNPFR